MTRKIGIALDKRTRFHRDSYEIEEGIIKRLEGEENLIFLIPFSLDDNILDEYADFLDYLVIGGHGDVSPAVYREDPKFKDSKFDLERDLFNLRLTQKMLERKKPILGLGRGALILNAYYGGKLYESIEDEVEGAICHKNESGENLHFIDLPQGHFLENFIVTRPLVHSSHRGGIRELGYGLREIARSSDGLVEAFESEEDRTIGLVFDLDKGPENEFKEMLLEYFYGTDI